VGAAPNCRTVGFATGILVKIARRDPTVRVRHTLPPFPRGNVTNNSQKGRAGGGGAPPSTGRHATPSLLPFPANLLFSCVNRVRSLLQRIFFQGFCTSGFGGPAEGGGDGGQGRGLAAHRWVRDPPPPPSCASSQDMLCVGCSFLVSAVLEGNLANNMRSGPPAGFDPTIVTFPLSICAARFWSASLQHVGMFSFPSDLSVVRPKS